MEKNMSMKSLLSLSEKESLYISNKLAEKNPTFQTNHIMVCP